MKYPSISYFTPTVGAEGFLFTAGTENAEDENEDVCL